MRAGPVLGLLLASMTLQGCVALAIPVVAAGVIGKKEVDKARARARAAEASFDPKAPQQPIPEVIVGPPVDDVVKAPAASTATASENAAPHTATTEENAGAMSALDRLALSGIQNAYMPFARWAIGQAQSRAEGNAARGAVLVESVSLSQPQTVDCGNKPMAALIDLDIAPGTPAEMTIDRQNGLAELLETVRESGIRLVWLAEADADQLAPILKLLKEGDAPVIRDADLMMLGLPPHTRKQQLRWQIAREYCVVAVAGDRRGDFDELYDYLRDPGYAIRLEGYMGKGWFELPHPVAAIDSERLEIPGDKGSK